MGWGFFFWGQALLLGGGGTERGCYVANFSDPPIKNWLAFILKKPDLGRGKIIFSKRGGLLVGP